MEKECGREGASEREIPSQVSSRWMLNGWCDRPSIHPRNRVTLTHTHRRGEDKRRLKKRRIGFECMMFLESFVSQEARTSFLCSRFFLTFTFWSL